METTNQRVAGDIRQTEESEATLGLEGSDLREGGQLGEAFVPVHAVEEQCGVRKNLRVEEGGVGSKQEGHITQWAVMDPPPSRAGRTYQFVEQALVQMWVFIVLGTVKSSI